jgi:2-hydroxy-6-oxonona-2,4-dienedioate hydrolase
MISYPVTVGDVSTRILQAGLSGPQILFIHGIGGRAERWARNLQGFADAGYRAYAVDLPGHGFATKGSGPDYSIDGFARLIAGVLDALGAEHVVLVGTSLGGNVAARYTLDNRDRVQALVLVGSLGLVPLGPDTSARIRGGAMDQSRAAVVAKLHRVIHDPTRVTEELIEEEFLVNNSLGAAAGFECLGDYVVANLDDDLVGDQLPDIAAQVPLLLVWGGQDTTVPVAVGRTASDRLSPATLVVIDDAAHSVYYEQPASFNATVLRFLDDQRVETPTSTPA